ncbi:MAG: SWIM zinc finger family protein [Candidatus Melainabacteria bacterium]|nr:SWIM zinc finger family protein [Candidatus Melainabacteria bacterium]
MSIAYTAEQILELAPDSSAGKAGRDLATASKWKNLGCSELAIWGECQGSGATPYQTRVDLSGPAFKCSCPSRKFPCKHSLGLALLGSANQALFEEKEPPAWVSDWLSGRGAKKRKETNESEKNPEQLEESLLAKDKRKQDRLSRVQTGIEELELFIGDLMRQGIGTVKKQPFAFWKSRAARLVDAQAPGLARLVSECAEIIARSSDWEDALIDKLATINLICRAFLKLEDLPPELKADVLTAIGVNQSQDELLGGAGQCLEDLWLVVGQYSYTQDRLRVQRNWLWSKRGQSALVLSFAHGTAPFDTMLIPGLFYKAELVFYQGSLTQRALIRSKCSEPAIAPYVSGLPSVGAALSSYARDLAKTPWLDTVAFLVEDVIPHRTAGGKWWLVDKEKNGLPLIVREETGWQLLSYAGGLPLTLFGEWDGTTLKPLAALKDSNYLRLQTVEI